MGVCKMKTEVYSRVCGYYRPVKYWNEGKQDEFAERKEYKIKECKDAFNKQREEDFTR